MDQLLKDENAMGEFNFFIQNLVIMKKFDLASETDRKELLAQFNEKILQLKAPEGSSSLSNKVQALEQKEEKA